MPLRSCSVCTELVDLRVYRLHRAGHYNAGRLSSDRRGYDARWRSRRREHLEREPWCRFHLAQGQRVPATEVDHILPRRAGGSDDHDNLRSLCKSCHSRRTAIDSSGWGGAKGA